MDATQLQEPNSSSGEREVIKKHKKNGQREKEKGIWL
jgi:hypothetical protein